MKYDLKYPRLLPLKLDHHVIVNVVTGEEFYCDKHMAVVAMMHLFGGQLGQGWSKGLPEEQRAEVMKFLFDMKKMERSGDVPPDFENDLLKVGPFVTWDKCTHNKNAELIAQRFERFTERMGKDVEKIDHEIAERLRADMDSGHSTILNDGNGGPEDLIVAEDADARSKVRTVRDVIGGNRRPGMGAPPGMPKELADLLFGGLGKVTSLGNGASVIEVDLTKLMKQKKDGEKKSDDGGPLTDMFARLFGEGEEEAEDEKKG